MNSTRNVGNLLIFDNDISWKRQGVYYLCLLKVGINKLEQIFSKKSVTRVSLPLPPSSSVLHTHAHVIYLNQPWRSAKSSAQNNAISLRATTKPNNANLLHIFPNTHCQIMCSVQLNLVWQLQRLWPKWCITHVNLLLLLQMQLQPSLHIQCQCISQHNKKCTCNYYYY